jgi:hypothetical protein
MMRSVFKRSILAAAAVAIAAISPASPAFADPQCPASGCPHGPANNPPSANVNSPSYQDGYKSEHDFYSTPQNHAYLDNEMKNGYNSALVCQTEIKGGALPPSPADWISGCVDALHDLGFKP